jgi:hypothetical protein
MPLNLSVGDGDFTPFMKYNAKAGRFYVRPEGATEEVEIVNPVLAFDMANIKTGWLFYSEGSGPEKIWDPSLTQAAPKPNDARKFKRGFEVMVYGNGIIPRTNQKLGLRELSSTAANVITAILRMYADYEASVAANPGAVPIFACEGVKPINGAYGVNYEPLFTLKGWVPRSRIPEFDEHAAVPKAPPRHDERNPPPIDDFGLDTVRKPSGETEIPF